MEQNPRRRIELLSMYTPSVDWSDEIAFDPVMLVDADSYKPKLLFPDVKPAKPFTEDPATYIEFETPDGRFWRYRNSRLPMGQHLETVSEERIEINDDGSTEGRVWFTGDVVFPVLTERKGPHANSEQVWMSITPMEIFTCRDGVRQAARHASKARHPGKKAIKKVVIAGLGLGWMLEKVASLKDVKEIVVVEQSEGLLDWYGRDMCESIKKVSDVIQGDYWEHAARLGDEYVHLIDIWPHLGQAYDDEHLKDSPFDDFEIQWWAWGYQFGEDRDSDQVLDADEAAARQLDGYDEDEDE
jgi:hypothetical protein